MRSLAQLFRCPPQPVRKPVGIYKCRRCGNQFEGESFAPCRADGGYKQVGGDYYWQTRTHRCDKADGKYVWPGCETWGLGDLIGAKVIVEPPKSD